MLTTTTLTVLSLSGVSEAFWRMSCGIIQTGRIDPIVSPGKLSSHVHKIAGAANIGISSTYDDLQLANCTSCGIQADKSTYWTPQLYYQHSNGKFEEVGNQGMTVYYLGRGDKPANIKPFPPGFRMISGDPLARSYDTSATTYNNARPIADRVSFACLDSAPMPETPGMNRTQCKNGLRAQIHFPSCWNGLDLYAADNSHVAYMSGMDNGVCPPDYPVQLMHLFYDVSYSMDSVTQDGGQFVFAHGDPTGYGFHGDFLNGWDSVVQAAAVKECATGDSSGAIQSCPPLAASDMSDFSQKCPPRPSLIDAPVTGLLDKLPGCIKVTAGPGRATLADMLCAAAAADAGTSSAIHSTSTTASAAGPTASSLVPRTGSSASSSTTNTSLTMTVDTTPVTVNHLGSYVFDGCYAEGTTGHALSDAGYTDPISMTVESCIDFCEERGFGLSGVEYALECYCGAQILNGAVRVAVDECNLPCRGNSSEYCGGMSRLDVYLSG
ncbi:MAG: hypothetical protein Q9217_003539 [Psora testacea]